MKHLSSTLSISLLVIVLMTTFSLSLNWLMKNMQTGQPTKFEDHIVNEHSDTCYININGLVEFKGTDEQAGSFQLSKTLFNQRPLQLVWVFLSALLIAISVGVVLFMLTEFRKFFKTYAVPVWLIGITIAFSIFLLSWAINISTGNNYTVHFANTAEQYGILFNNPANFYTKVMAPGVLAVGFCLAGVLCVAYASTRLMNRIVNEEKATNTELLKRYFNLQSKLTTYLALAGCLVVGAIVSTDVQGRLIEKIIQSDNFDFYPDAFLPVYGLLFSFCLALFFVPGHYFLRKTGWSLIEHLPTPDTSDLISWKNHRNTWEKELGLKVTFSNNLKNSLAIFSPLLGTAVTEFLALISHLG